jgi:hypothetical protein
VKKKKPSMKNYKIFGSICYYTTSTPSKLGDKLITGIYLGTETDNTFKVYNPTSDRIVIMRAQDCIVNEDELGSTLLKQHTNCSENLMTNRITQAVVLSLPGTVSSSDDESESETRSLPIRSSNNTPATPAVRVVDQVENRQVENNRIASVDDLQLVSEHNSNSVPDQNDEDDSEEKYEAQQALRENSLRSTPESNNNSRELTESESNSGVRRSERIKKPNLRYQVNNISVESERVEEPDPTTYKEAAKKIEWVKSMKKEIDAFVKHHVWTPVHYPSVEIRREAIPTKWVYKTKRSGSEVIYKSRLVAQGFHQSDFGLETYAPVASPSAIRLLLSLAVKQKFKISQYDISNAFLQGSMDPDHDDVFVIVPPGTGHPDGTIMKLYKGLYGLKQSPRLWNKELVNALLNAKYIQSELDKSIFYKVINGKLLIIIVFVDDLFCLSETSNLVDDFLYTVLSKFEHKSISPVKTFVGLQLIFLADGSTILHQNDYINKFLTKYDFF